MPLSEITKIREVGEPNYFSLSHLSFNNIQVSLLHTVDIQKHVSFY